MTNIITAEQASEMTGTAGIVEADVVKAQGILSVITGVDFEVDSADALPYAKRDVRTLRTAIAWQAAYVHANGTKVDNAVASVREAVSASTNGVSVNYGTAETVRGTLGGIVAPLASMALRRLSWRGSRSVRMVPSRRTLLRAQTLVLDGDDAEWRRL